jgi:hypothetical protein
VEARRHCRSLRELPKTMAVENRDSCTLPASARYAPEQTQNLTDGEFTTSSRTASGYRYARLGSSGPNDHETRHLVLFIRHPPHLTEEDRR